MWCFYNDACKVWGLEDVVERARVAPQWRDAVRTHRIALVFGLAWRPQVPYALGEGAAAQRKTPHARHSNPEENPLNLRSAA